MVGFDLKARLSLTFAGSISAQLNSLVPLHGAAGKFLVLRNNAPGLALLDFAATGTREAETRRIDLAAPAALGALRFNRLRNLAASEITVEARTSNATDEVEGWTPWTALKLEADGGWRAAHLRGRGAKLRIRLAPPAAAPDRTKETAAEPRTTVEIDRAALFALPQNHRPQLQDFRLLSPGFGLVVSPEQPPSPIVSLSQLLQSAPRDDDKRKGSFPSSQIVPQPGAQVVLWTIVDAEGDTFTSTFSIRREGDDRWIDVVANTKDSYAQFDTAHLPDGVYFTRLVAKETAPRVVEERLTQTFETDDLIIDHTAPEIMEATAKRNADSVVITVRGRDQLSLLDGVEFNFNNSVRETVEQPADGVRDGREETFALDIPLARISNATSVEVTLYDAAGNSSARRLTW